MNTLFSLLAKLMFNVLNEICPSSLMRARLLKVYGAKIGDKVKVEKVILMHFDGFNLRNLTLNDRAFIGPGTILDIKGNIKIGRSVKIGPGCNISTHVDAGKENLANNLYPARIEDVLIGNGVWVGASVTVLCGVVIGDDAVIGAGSLVNKNVPTRNIAYGVPIRIKRQG